MSDVAQPLWPDRDDRHARLPGETSSEYARRMFAELRADLSPKEAR